MMADITEEEFVELKEAFALYEKEGCTDINRIRALFKCICYYLTQYCNAVKDWINNSPNKSEPAGQ